MKIYYSTFSLAIRDRFFKTQCNDAKVGVGVKSYRSDPKPSELTLGRVKADESRLKARTG